MMAPPVTSAGFVAKARVRALRANQRSLDGTCTLVGGLGNCRIGMKAPS
jgi:hypothetical protein